jgi:hypothetical protein
MTTFPIVDPESGRIFAFEVENAYVSPRDIGRILAGIEGVSALRMRPVFRPPSDEHLSFRYRNQACTVWEPYADSSRYWIGPRKGRDVCFSEIEAAFRAYDPPLAKRLLGDLLTLRPLTHGFGRGKDRG